MQHLSQIMGKRLEKHHLKSEASASVVVFRANEHLKEWLKTEPENVQVVSLQQSQLVIDVAHPVWGQEVHRFSDRLVSELQKEFGKKRIEKVRIRTKN